MQVCGFQQRIWSDSISIRKQTHANLMYKNSSFNDRLKRLGCQQLNHLRGKNRTKTALISTSTLALNLSTETLEQMQAEIASLSTQLQQKDIECTKWQEYAQQLTITVKEKDTHTAFLSQQLLHSQNANKSLKERLDAAESQLENLKLRQKIESISQQLNKQQQPISSPLKHQKHKQGKFSATTITTTIGSHKKLQINTGIPKAESKAELNSHSFLRSQFSGYLIDQWQRSKDQSSCKQLELANLQAKLAASRKEIVRQAKQIEVLKSRKPSGGQMVALMQENRQMERRNKVILMKLRESEKRRREMIALLKVKGEVLEEDKFYGYSTLADINQMIEKSVQNLEIDTNVVQVLICARQRTETFTQTSRMSLQQEKIEQLQTQIKFLSSQLAAKQDQFQAKYHQMRQHYQSEAYQQSQQLESLSRQLQRSCQAQNSHISLSVTNAAIQCLLITSTQDQKQKDIIEKAVILIDLNQQLTHKLTTAQNQNSSLSEQLQKYRNSPSVTEVSVQCQDWKTTQIDEDMNCPTCILANSKIFELKEEMDRLKRVITAVKEEKQHFKNCYQETITNYKQLETESISLRRLIEEKQQNLTLLGSQIMQRSAEIDRYRSDILIMETRLRQLQQMKENWQLEASS